MKSRILLIAMLLTGITFTSCSKDDEPVVVQKKMNVTRVETNQDAESEMAEIGKNGFRLVELNNKVIARESVWKLENNKWTAGQELETIKKDAFAAIYPADKEINGTKVTFKPGKNNMLVYKAAKASENEISFVFQHKMCRVSYKVQDNKGNEVKDIEVVLEQPSSITYDIADMTAEPVFGESKDIAIEPGLKTVYTYVIPGAKKNIFKVKVNGDKNFSYTTEAKFEANKVYDIILDMNKKTKTFSISSMNVH